MLVYSKEKIDLSLYRLGKAKEALKDAKKTLELEMFGTAANRSYYAIFSAMRAVLALDGFDSKKHSGVIAEFRRRYIKTNILPRDISPMIEELVEVRQGSDYDDFYFLTHAEVAEQLKNAHYFVQVIDSFLLTQYQLITPKEIR